jgi:ADP-ribosylglycohydrolase
LKFDKEKTRKLLVGLATGDCQGITTEFFKDRNIYKLYKKYKKRGWPFTPVGREQWNMKAGEHSDDTDMAWAVVKSAYQKQSFDPSDIANNFVKWLHSNPKDIGNTTHEVLSGIANGSRWNESGRAFYEGNKQGAANGSLMRNGVINGLTDDLDEAFEMSLLHGIITHYAPLPVICCAIHTWVIHKLFEGVNPLEDLMWQKTFFSDWETWLNNSKNEDVITWKETVGKEDIEEEKQTILKTEFHHYEFNPYIGNFSRCAGYCLLTLQIALWALQWALDDKKFLAPMNLPEEVFAKNGVWTLGWVSLIGYDADTYAAVTGPLFAAKFGELPKEMTSNLQIHGWWNQLTKEQ